MSNTTTLTANAEANSSTLLLKALEAYDLADWRLYFCNSTEVRYSDLAFKRGLKAMVCKRLLGEVNFELLLEVCSTSEMTKITGAKYLRLI